MQRFLWIILSLAVLAADAKLPEITPPDVSHKAKELMKAHASHKKLTPVLAERILDNYLDHLDSNKTYFIESDITVWLNPSDDLLKKIVADYSNHDFTVFHDIQAAWVKAILRRRQLDQKVKNADLPVNVKPSDLKDKPWAKNEDELFERLKKIKALQLEGASKLNEEMKEKSFQRIAKYKAKFEDEALNDNAEETERLILANILKATALALDSQTMYFTPGEATQFLFGVQQRLFGIGAQLRDDINGLSIVKIVEGGPAALNRELKEKDRIIAVNGEPIVGMGINDSVNLIRGEENTPVTLTIIREKNDPKNGKTEEKLDITIVRGEVVLKETRITSSYEPFGDGVIGHVRLHSFYQDRNTSSAEDLKREIETLKSQHKLSGLILDLRNNTGGLLTEAVDVTGLFITKGIVVSIKDEKERLQHLRVIDEEVTWDGPLVILVNRMSASASEIVAQTLQDYGRAIVVGDEHTFGKGSYQTFTLTTDDQEQVNPEGEYKVTRGRYYTVSGKTPQLTGVAADVCIPGPYCEAEVGEKFNKYPLENDHIAAHFDDDLADIPFYQRGKIQSLYLSTPLQQKVDLYGDCLAKLKENAEQRIAASTNYQNFLKEVRKKEDYDPDNQEKFGLNDLQLDEAIVLMKDLLVMLHEKGRLAA